MDTEKEKKKALSISTACKNTVTEGQGEKQKFRNKMEVMCKSARRGSDRGKKQLLCKLLAWGKGEARNQGEEML